MLKYTLKINSCLPPFSYPQYQSQHNVQLRFYLSHEPGKNRIHLGFDIRWGENLAPRPTIAVWHLDLLAGQHADHLGDVQLEGVREPT